VLAYLFWHSPAPGTEQADYEALLAAFHESLAASQIEGLACSAAFLVRGLTWLGAGAPSYEDWYLLEDFAALGRLNEAAVTGRRTSPHDAVAARAGTGTAGVYAHRGVAVPSPRGDVAVWFSRTPGSSYDEVFARAPSEGELWQRQMTLGPTPELCLLRERPLEVGDDLLAGVPTVVVRERTIVALGG